MITGVAARISALLCVFLLCTLPSLRAEKHSLYYIYTTLSKPVELPHIHQFTAMGLLDDRQIDCYNSRSLRKIPKQTWMKERLQEDYWEKGTQSRKSKEQWFHVNVDILMKRMNHSESDVHILQWRVGCEVEKKGDEVKFSKGINEYGYDGEDFLSFDAKESQWVAPVDAALPTKRKWDNIPILNQYTKGYLEKECVDWLNKFREYGDEELRKGSPPKVHGFTERSIKDKSKKKLTCMGTGFSDRDVLMTIRKYRISLPEYETESTGIRPNHDGTYQMRMSVQIKENEKADYDCFVSHRTFNEPVIIVLGNEAIRDAPHNALLPASATGLIAAVSVGLFVLVVVHLVVCIVKKMETEITDYRRTDSQELEHPNASFPSREEDYIFWYDIHMQRD